MNYKKWIKIWFITISIFPIIGILNYLIDPYGLNNNKNKFIGTLTYGNNPSILNLKVNLKADYYLIGSSRVMRVNPILIEDYLVNKKVYNVNISGSTFKENLIVSNKIKNNKKNIIFGFDAFTLNKNRFNSGALVSRYNAYEKALRINSTYPEYLSMKYISATFKDIKRRARNKKLNEYILFENQKTGSYSIEDIEENLDISNKGTKKHFTNFELVEDNDIIKLAKSATKDDIFIIYPKYFLHYILFQKHQNIEQKYFNGIKLLVKNTKAKVWSFYKISSITKDKTNFDDKGWHFKPKISNLIFAKIFNDKSINVPKDFGTLITKDNVDKHLKNIHEEIKMNNQVYDLNRI